MKKIINWVMVNTKSKLTELIFSRDSFLVKSNMAQKKAEIKHIKIGIK